MSQKIPGDNDIYCAAIARRLGMSVEAYKDTLDKEKEARRKAGFFAVLC